jgi:hypothetical protein
MKIIKIDYHEGEIVMKILVTYCTNVQYFSRHSGASGINGLRLFMGENDD